MKVIVLSNIADLIEEYILRRLAAEKTRRIELQRTQLANEISCAPSQISYVLSTRFTHDKGFMVESRRGLGGFIRIAQIPLQNLIYQDILDKIDVETTSTEVQSMLRYLLQHQLILHREAALVMQMLTFTYEKLPAEERVELLRSIFLTLANFA
jgi:transcriptional regulator of stress and heat shock response